VKAHSLGVQLRLARFRLLLAQVGFVFRANVVVLDCHSGGLTSADMQLSHRLFAPSAKRNDLPTINIQSGRCCFLEYVKQISSISLDLVSEVSEVSGFLSPFLTRGIFD
jgi:hypothetical protein